MGIKSKIKKILCHLSENNTLKKEEYYPLSKTCQIPLLSIIFEQYFGQKKDGIFVEFGAFDGEYSSNTSGLADIGWYGHYIEPIPEFNTMCKMRHFNNKNIKIYDYAIGDKNDSVDIFIGGPLSTISSKMRKHFQNLEWSKSCFEKEKKISVPMITLEDFFNEIKIKHNFELLVIDVEGYEWKILQNFNLSKWNPQMVIIELHDQNPDYCNIRDECNNLVNFFNVNNYKVIYKDFINTIYVPKNSFPIILKQ
jgi:FkbM family methyltransferase